MSSGSEKQVSYCRICPAGCGVVVELDSDRIVRVKPDVTNPASGGYTCVKGRNAAEMSNHTDRLRTALARGADGTPRPSRPTARSPRSPNGWT